MLFWGKHIFLYFKNEAFSYLWALIEPFREDSILPCPDRIPQELRVKYWFRKNDVVNHPNSKHYFQPRTGLKRFASVNEAHLDPYKARRISAAEALAIQSLPKNFVLPLSMPLTNMFKTIDSGVPYLALRAIAKTILDFSAQTWDDQQSYKQQLEPLMVFSSHS